MGEVMGHFMAKLESVHPLLKEDAIRMEVNKLVGQMALTAGTTQTLTADTKHTSSNVERLPYFNVQNIDRLLVVDLPYQKRREVGSTQFSTLRSIFPSASYDKTSRTQPAGDLEQRRSSKRASSRLFTSEGNLSRTRVRTTSRRSTSRRSTSRKSTSRKSTSRKLTSRKSSSRCASVVGPTNKQVRSPSR